MTISIASLKFRFQEDLALKSSLYPIGDIVLEYAVKASGANSAIFLYAAPGSEFFEKVSSFGLSKSESAAWAKRARIESLPLLESIRSQKFIEIKTGTSTEIMAFPLVDADISSAGFSISFQPARVMDSDTREFLFLIAQLAGNALFRQEGEGV